MQTCWCQESLLLSISVQAVRWQKQTPPDYIYIAWLSDCEACRLFKTKIKPADISLNGIHSNALRVSGEIPCRGLQLITRVCKPRFWHLDLVIYEWWKAHEVSGGVEQLICAAAALIHQECCLLIRSPVLMHCRGIWRMLLGEWEDNK